MKIYPWQKQQWLRLMQSIQAERLHHALLLHGPEGIGLEHFSRCLAFALLTQQQSEDGVLSDEGRNAGLFLAGSHPDLFILQPEEDSRVIKVDQMREMIDFIHLKSHFGHYKVAIIEPAEVMNSSAANGLLKTLEEPPELSIIILNTSAPGRLPVTIRSRCQKHGFAADHSDETQQWLQDHLQDSGNTELLLKLAGTPLSAIEMLETGQLEIRQKIISELLEIKRNQTSPLELAGIWKAYDSKQLADWLLKIFSDLARLSVSASRNTVQNIDLTENLNLLRKGLDLTLLLECLDSIRTLNRTLNGSISYNKEALLEEFLIFWQALKHNAA